MRVITVCPDAIVTVAEAVVESRREMLITLLKQGVRKIVQMPMQWY